MPLEYESAEVMSPDEQIAITQGATRQRFNAVVNGVNDAVEVGVTAVSYTAGRTKRTFHQMLENYSAGRKGEQYGLSA